MDPGKIPKEGGNVEKGLKCENGLKCETDYGGEPSLPSMAIDGIKGTNQSSLSPAGQMCHALAASPQCKKGLYVIISGGIPEN